jgi:hypothetical protein
MRGQNSGWKQGINCYGKHAPEHMNDWDYLVNDGASNHGICFGVSLENMRHCRCPYQDPGASRHFQDGRQGPLAWKPVMS